LVWIISFLSISYFIFLLLLIRAWSGIKELEILNSDYPFISVIIPVRNEAHNITPLIRCLENQAYAYEHFEVIFIDDYSEDGTYEQLINFSKKSVADIRVYQLEKDAVEGTSHKKAAITYGMTKASGELILLTDGDVLLERNWIQVYAGAFTGTDSKFISGPVVMDGEGFIDDVQSLEFSSLIGAGAAAIYYNKPILCNGANLAFRKEAFFEVKGYEGYEKIISGDDEFLMYKISKRYPSGISFLKSIQAIVHIQPKSGISEFYDQRRRWSGKWRKHPNPLSKALAIYIFIVHLSFLLLFIFGISKLVTLNAVILLLAIKLLLEFIYFKLMYRFLIKRLKVIPFMISSLVYPLYAVTFGILSNLGGYEWKERHFKN